MLPEGYCQKHRLFPRHFRPDADLGFDLGDRRRRKKTYFGDVTPVGSKPVL
jgi:hypothetical protein